MSDYYAKNLSSTRLQKCYDVAPPRTRQYLKAELDKILSYINIENNVIELGCGYGRVIKDICSKSSFVTGIDNSIANLYMASEYLKQYNNVSFTVMDAAQLGFTNNCFDITLCIQNGISAFKTEPEKLVTEAVRITRPGGLAVFSSYSEKFWDDRLHWFELQAKEGLLGEIDYDKTGDGVIVCKDGFRATTFTPEQFEALTSNLNLKADIFEVDDSSVFCTIQVD